MMTPSWEPSTLKFNLSNLKHLLPVFGKRLTSSIEAIDISRYQADRRNAGASNRTINMEIGTLRPILKRTGDWPHVLTDVRTLKVPVSKGKFIPETVLNAILQACQESRSRSLYPYVVLDKETGSRAGTVTRVKWENVDFLDRCLQWGRDKTVAGSGRVVPLNNRAMAVLEFWASCFPDRQPDHFVFPYERYGGCGHRFGGGSTSIPYRTDPTRPMGSNWKAWNEARIRAARILSGDPEDVTITKPVPYRLHDLRHTLQTKMRNNNVPLEKTAKVLGWSPSQTVRMAGIYGHFSLDDLRDAVETVN
jgi:integrase